MNTATTSYEPVELEDLLDEMGLGMDGRTTPPPLGYAPRVMPPAHVEVAVEVASPVRSRALGRLLALADGYLRSDSLHQALEMYFNLMDRYPDAPEALQAEERLLEVANRHEQAGELRSARAIYERMA
jgi:hypothetical protein